MGNDEHGPAYPEPYHCPICSGDENRYLSCEHPGCFDGRDRNHPHRLLRETYPTEDETAQIGPSWTQILIGWGFVAALILYTIWPAHAMDHGFDPNSATTRWFEGLQRPNHPGSCCGASDAYPATYIENPDGSAEVTITDGTAKLYPDGTRRAQYTGGVIHVPKEFVNKYEDDLDNPTDTSWIFVAVYGGEANHTYCLIRHPSGG